LESALASVQAKLSEADERTRRLENEFAAFRSRRSVRAAVTFADAAYATKRFWSKKLRPRTSPASADAPRPAPPIPTEKSAASAPATLRISAVIPCFNASAYLEEALSSIKGQTRPVDEIIVVDDGSTDGSAELAERLGATVIRHDTNRGEGAARNTGWQAATGDAVAWLDADDTWRPNHVKVVAALLEGHPEAACAFGAAQRFGLDDAVVTGLVPEGGSYEMLNSAFQSWLHTPIVSITRRSALEEIGGCDGHGRMATDFDMWLRLARHNRFVATHEVTVNWRWHNAQQSAGHLRQIIGVQRYRRRFLKALRAEGDYLLAEELEPLMRPSWTAHLEGAREGAEQRRKRTLESVGQTYRGPSFMDRTRWTVLSHLPPTIVDLAWRVSGGRLEL
jgi:hypothetical protein